MKVCACVVGLGLLWFPILKVEENFLFYFLTTFSFFFLKTMKTKMNVPAIIVQPRLFDAPAKKQNKNWVEILIAGTNKLPPKEKQKALRLWRLVVLIPSNMFIQSENHQGGEWLHWPPHAVAAELAGEPPRNAFKAHRVRVDDGGGGLTPAAIATFTPPPTHPQPLHRPTSTYGCYTVRPALPLQHKQHYLCWAKQPLITHEGGSWCAGGCWGPRLQTLGARPPTAIKHSLKARCLILAHSSLSEGFFFFFQMNKSASDLHMHSSWYLYSARAPTPPTSPTTTTRRACLIISVPGSSRRDRRRQAGD